MRKKKNSNNRKSNLGRDFGRRKCSARVRPSTGGSGRRAGGSGDGRFARLARGPGGRTGRESFGRPARNSSPSRGGVDGRYPYRPTGRRGSDRRGPRSDTHAGATPDDPPGSGTLVYGGENARTTNFDGGNLFAEILAHGPERGLRFWARTRRRINKPLKLSVSKIDFFKLPPTSHRCSPIIHQPARVLRFVRTLHDGVLHIIYNHVFK